jgi:hypothetical protein
MKQIWKFPIGNEAQATIKMPIGASILRIAVQKDSGLCIWAFVDPELALEDRSFKLFGTGHNVPGNFAYVGTVDEGPFVWHLFERTTAHDN